MKTITLLFAMEAEAAPFLAHFDFKEKPSLVDAPLPMQGFECQWQTLTLYAYVSGKDPRFQVDNIGCEPATLMAHQALKHTQPDLLITAGTAGGFTQHGAAIGTVYLSHAYFVFHDRHVPLGAFEPAAIGAYPSYRSDDLAKALNLPQGNISSGSSLAKNTQDFRIIEQYNAVAKDMESAAIAWVAQLYQCPLLGIKAITNLVDLNNQSEVEFEKHFSTAVAALTQQLKHVVDYFNQHSLLP